MYHVTRNPALSRLRPKSKREMSGGMPKRYTPKFSDGEVTPVWVYDGDSEGEAEDDGYVIWKANDG